MNYVLTDDAEADLRGIIRYTRKEWGAAQVRAYVAKLKAGIARVAAGQGVFKELDALYPALRMARCEHHYVFCLPLLPAAPERARVDRRDPPRAHGPDGATGRQAQRLRIRPMTRPRHVLEARESFKQEALASSAAYKKTGRHLTGQGVRTWLSAWGTHDERAVRLKC